MHVFVRTCLITYLSRLDRTPHSLKLFPNVRISHLVNEITADRIGNVFTARAITRDFIASSATRNAYKLKQFWYLGLLGWCWLDTHTRVLSIFQDGFL